MWVGGRGAVAVESRNMLNAFRSMPDRRRRGVLAAMCALFVLAVPSLWSLADSFAADQWPRYKMYRLKQQSLSEAEQEGFRERNERLILETVGLPPPLIVQEILTRTHSPESADNVNAVTSRMELRAPDVERAQMAWYEENPAAPAPKVVEQLNQPIIDACNVMIAKLKARGFDLYYDNVSDYGRYVGLAQDGGAVRIWLELGVSRPVIEVRRYV